MSDIFISYASADRDKAERIAKVLNSRGWTVWWDRTIPPGKTFDEVIEDAIDSTACIVVLWSAASVTSDWVKTEASEGSRRKVLVPILIDEVKIPLEFRRIQAANLVGWDNSPAHPELVKVYHSIAEISGKPVRNEREQTANGEAKPHEPTVDKDAKTSTTAKNADEAPPKSIAKAADKAPSKPVAKEPGTVQSNTPAKDETPKEQTGLRGVASLLLLGAVITTCICWYEVQSIVASGPVLTLIGIIMAIIAKRHKNKLGVWIGLSALFISILCSVIIMAFGLNPSDAQLPISAIVTIYTLALIYVVFARLKTTPVTTVTVTP